MLPDPAFRAPIITFTACTMLATLALLGLTVRCRAQKMIRASTPGLLYVTLGGAILLYSEVIVASLVASDVTCTLRVWVRHFGFALGYGGLLFKTWRISTILSVFKARQFRRRDQHVYAKLSATVALWAVFLAVWTLRQPITAFLPDTSSASMCRLSAWNFCAIAGELVYLGWGATLCYRARRAPDLYNESRQISYAIWNEALWQVFIVIARILLARYPDSNVLLVVRFLRTQFTVTAMLILLFAPKLLVMSRRFRELRDVTTEVYGTKRVHRLSLLLNKHGHVKSVYCVPCGPLQPFPSDDSPSSEPAPEDQYSRAEVDALIDMVTRLRTEKNQFKSEIAQLKWRRSLDPSGRSSRASTTTTTCLTPLSPLDGGTEDATPALIDVDEPTPDAEHELHVLLDARQALRLGSAAVALTSNRRRTRPYGDDEVATTENADVSQVAPANANRPEATAEDGTLERAAKPSKPSGSRPTSSNFIMYI